MDVRLLEYFLAVVDHGGFGRAADALHVAQPSLSQAIARLERETKCELFHRVGRGVVLSDAGAALVEPARQVVRDIEIAADVLESTKGLERGHVHIAAMSSPGIEPLGALVSAFTETHPGMTVHAAAAFEPADAIRMVRDGETELGLIGTPDPTHPPGLKILALEAQRFALVAPPGWPLPDTELLNLEQVTDLRIVASPPGSLMRRVVDDAIAAGAGLSIVAEVAHRTSILPFVLQGIGGAVVPSAWSCMARAAGLATAPLAHPARLHITLLRRPGVLSPAATAFVAQARAHRERLRARPDAVAEPADLPPTG